MCICLNHCITLTIGIDPLSLYYFHIVYSIFCLIFLLLDCPQCPNDICENVSCPNFPNARCQPEKCGINCNATFFLKGVNVGDLCGKEIKYILYIELWDKLN